MLGTLVTSVKIDSEADLVHTSERVATRVRNYWAKSRGAHSIWVLEAEALTMRRSDGLPYVRSDILSLQGKDGRWLSRGQSPDQMAEAFRNQGVTVSYTKVGEPGSAVGRVFEFEDHEFKLGKTFKKSVQLFPKTIMPVGYVYEGEVQIINVSDAGAAAEGYAPPAGGVSEAEAIAILQQDLIGRTPDEAFDIIAGDSRLKTVATVCGQPLLESATDDSLVGLLQENHILFLDESGRFTLSPAPAPVTA